MNLPDRAAQAAQGHISLLNARLPGALDSYYIIGSVALGAFEEGFSDVDFVVLLRGRPDGAALNELKQLHRELCSRFPQTALDGLYITQGDLTGQAGAQAYPRFNHGKFLGLKAFEPGSVAVWELKKHGVCLSGRAPESLPFDVSPETLLSRMRANLDTYWRKWVRKCRNPFSPWFYGIFGLGAVEWGVLGISRLYYTFCEKDVTSKAGAGEYALQHVPEPWRGIVREALARKQNRVPQYISAPLRRRHALAYVEYMIDECCRLYDGGTDNAGETHG